MLDEAEMLTIEPPPAALMCGMAYLLAHSVPYSAVWTV
jgi:hypothetical protein